MNYKQGGIYLVNFDPSYGHEYQKVRPAIIVENDKFISSGSLLTLIPISSKVEKIFPLDVLVKCTKQNRLMTDSIIKTTQISSFDKRRIIKYVGLVDDDVLSSLNSSILQYLEINR